MRKILAIVALAEAGTGLLLLVWPRIVVRPLVGADIDAAGVIMSRLAGIALIGLGVACWSSHSPHQSLKGMLTYSTLAMLYLGAIGIRGEAVGVLLWPAVVAHAVFNVLLFRMAVKREKTQASSVLK